MVKTMLLVNFIYFKVNLLLYYFLAWLFGITLRTFLYQIVNQNSIAVKKSSANLIKIEETAFFKFFNLGMYLIYVNQSHLHGLLNMREQFTVLDLKIFRN